MSSTTRKRGEVKLLFILAIVVIIAGLITVSIVFIQKQKEAQIKVPPVKLFKGNDIVLEAENMKATTGGLVPEGWALYSNGKLTKQFKIPEKWAGKELNIQIIAKGDEAKPVPQLISQIYIIDKNTAVKILAEEGFNMSSSDLKPQVEVTYTYSFGDAKYLMKRRNITLVEFKQHFLIRNLSPYTSFDPGEKYNGEKSPPNYFVNYTISSNFSALYIDLFDKEAYSDSWPHIKILINGKQTSDIRIGSAVWKAYDVSFLPDKDTVKLELVYYNDYHNWTPLHKIPYVNENSFADRNLYVEKAIISAK